jgi:hypothetical protein
MNIVDGYNTGEVLFRICANTDPQRDSTSLITYAVQPFPAGIAVKWFLSGVAQGVLLGLLVFFVYKPKPAEAKPQQ